MNMLRPAEQQPDMANRTLNELTMSSRTMTDQSFCSALMALSDAGFWIDSGCERFA
jgi:hypothetical protein